MALNTKFLIVCDVALLYCVSVLLCCISNLFITKRDKKC